jgi:hypothetical protein
MKKSKCWPNTNWRMQPADQVNKQPVNCKPIIINNNLMLIDSLINKEIIIISSPHLQDLGGANAIARLQKGLVCPLGLCFRHCRRHLANHCLCRLPLESDTKFPSLW